MRIKHLNIKPGDLINNGYACFIVLVVSKRENKNITSISALRLSDMFIIQFSGSFSCEIIKGFDSCQ